MCLTAIRASARPMARERAAPTTSHFDCACYHPLFVFNHLGDVEQRALRPSNVHSTDAACGARTGSGPLSGIAERLSFRGDGASANPEIYEFLEAEGIGSTIGLPAISAPRRCSGATKAKLAFKCTRLSCRTFVANAGASPAPCAGLQSRQLHASAGDAEGGGAVVTNQPMREAAQDRRQGGEPWA
jgi:hypothetical protein